MNNDAYKKNHRVCFDFLSIVLSSYPQMILYEKHSKIRKTQLIFCSVYSYWKVCFDVNIRNF